MAGLREYFQQTFEERLMGSLPDEVLSQPTPATQLLMRKQEMDQVEAALSAQKEEFRQRMEALRQRRSELERKEAQLQESLVKFDRFLKENDARRERAERKRKEEEGLTVVRDRELDELQGELSQLTARRVQNKVLLSRYDKYEAYLKKVIDHASEYNEIEDIVARHSALTTTNDDLRHREAATHNAMDSLKRETAAFKEEHRVHMLNCNNRLAALLAKREEAETSALHWENRFGEVQSTATTRTLLLGQIKMATANLFALVQRQARVAQAADNPLDQLEKVQHYLQDLQDIIDKFEAEQAEAEAEAATANLI